MYLDRMHLHRHDWYSTRGLLRIPDPLDTPNIRILKGFNISTSEFAMLDILLQCITLREATCRTALSLYT